MSVNKNKCSVVGVSTFRHSQHSIISQDVHNTDEIMFLLASLCAVYSTALPQLRMNVSVWMEYYFVMSAGPILYVVEFMHFK